MHDMISAALPPTNTDPSQKSAARTKTEAALNQDHVYTTSSHIHLRSSLSPATHLPLTTRPIPRGTGHEPEAMGQALCGPEGVWERERRDLR